MDCHLRINSLKSGLNRWAERCWNYRDSILGLQRQDWSPDSAFRDRLIQELANSDLLSQGWLHRGSWFLDWSG
jgi:hypothetical protein